MKAGNFSSTINSYIQDGAGSVSEPTMFNSKTQLTSLFRIEKDEQHQGGVIEWNMPIRLRQDCSGLVLAVQKDKVVFTEDIDSDSLFIFQQVAEMFIEQNFVLKYQLVTIQHIDTKMYLEIPLEVVEGDEIAKFNMKVVVTDGDAY